ncbi:MAG: nucleotide pyrophosphohydrolase [Bacillota bacterium]|nr:MAG: nucleotide pyrophosphohydrolase [Bacillota bacterium]
MLVRDMQQQVDDWISQFEEGYWPPLANLARLIEEVGELARELNHHFGPKTKKPTEAEGSIAEELADCLFVLVCMANSLDIDLEAAFSEMMDKYRRRDARRWKRKPSHEPEG